MIFLNASYLEERSFVFQAEGEMAQSISLPSFFVRNPHKCSVIEAVQNIFPLCAGRLFSPGVVVSDELRVFSALAKFAAALVLKQNFIPSVLDGSAAWVPLQMDGEILEKFTCASPLFDAEFTQKILYVFVDEIVRTSAADIDIRGARTPHEKWLSALASPKTSKTELAEEILNWQRNPRLRLESPLRIKISLTEPKGSSKNAPSWGVRCAVSSDGKKFTDIFSSLKNSGGEEKELLFSALVRISRLSPVVADFFRTKQKITDFEPLEKLVSHEAKKLSEFGIEFEKPWWNDEKNNKNAKIKITAHVAADGEFANFGSVANVSWSATLGEREISADDLKNFLKNPIVKVGEKFALLSMDEITNALKFFKNKKEAVHAYEILRMSLDKNFEIHASGRLGELLSQLEKREDFEQLPQPSKLEARLRPYQSRGFSWLAFMMKYGLGACLADDMGLGKTIQTLAAVLEQKEWRANRPKKPILLVCPTSLLENWHREGERFSPSLRVFIHHGAGRLKDAEFTKKISSYDIVITSYALAARDEFLRAVDWLGVILDEAQNIKNPETAQSQAVRALNGEWRIALTGTPIENSVADLWAQMDFLNRGIMGTWGEYNRLYVREFKKTHAVAILDEVKRVTSPFILRRLKSDKTIISDLPEKIETKQFCELTDEQIELYEAASNLDEIENSEGIKRKGMILGLLVRLKQICNHPVLYQNGVGEIDNFSLAGRSGKLERLDEIIRCLGKREKMLIFSQFAEMTSLMQRYIEENFGEECLVMHGGINVKDRGALVRNFQSGEGARFFALTMKTGGAGLNLTEASHVVLFDRWWNPAVEQQAVDRAFRIGQKKNVQVHNFICAHTVEDWIDSLIDGKKNVAGKVISNGEEWLLNLSTDELKKIIQYGGRK